MTTTEVTSTAPAQKQKVCRPRAHADSNDSTTAERSQTSAQQIADRARQPAETTQASRSPAE
eukprot:452455-Prymnesium_polylepis.1